jgi:hypothetical protein
VLLYDDLKRDPQRFLEDFCRFIEIQPPVLENSPIGPGIKVNTMDYGPRSFILARMATLVRRSLASLGAHRLIDVADRSRLVNRVSSGIYNGRPIAMLDRVTSRRLRWYFRPEVEKLEEMLGRDLSAWKEA